LPPTEKPTTDPTLSPTENPTPDPTTQSPTVLPTISPDWCIPSGVQIDLPVRDIPVDWELVYFAPYRDHTEFSDFSAIEDGCVFFGAKKNDRDPEFYIGAFNLANLVLKETYDMQNASYSNGAYWYNYPSKAIGFADMLTVQLNPCDTSAQSRIDPSCHARMCWNLDTDTGGYRAGCAFNLGRWYKYVYAGPCCLDDSYSGSFISGDSEICELHGGSDAEGNVILNGMAICDDYWDHTNAKVVCRALGYEIGFATTGSYFGIQNEDFFMVDIYCLGDESSISDCVYLKRNIGCHGNDAAGVICLNEEKHTRIAVISFIIGGAVFAAIIVLACCWWRRKSRQVRVSAVIAGENSGFCTPGQRERPEGEQCTNKNVTAGATFTPTDNQASGEHSIIEKSSGTNV